MTDKYGNWQEIYLMNKSDIWANSHSMQYIHYDKNMHISWQTSHHCYTRRL